MRNIAIILLPLLFFTCSGEPTENLSKRIDQLIAEDNYTQALELLDDVNADQVEADITTLKEKTYLNYGLYFEYRGPKGSSMRDRMTSALEQYIEVLKINPQNEKAQSEVNKIMGVYSTMPENSPGEEILEELRGLGFDY